jgi:hypothetical protein
MGNSYSRVAPPIEPGMLSASGNPRRREHAPAGGTAALPENIFQSMLTLERRRAERSNKAFVLMLLDANLENGSASGILKQAFNVAMVSKRETDLVGWYKENTIVGVIFTEVNLDGDRAITETLRAKIETSLIKHLGQDRAGKIAISLHVFPEGQDKNHSGWAKAPRLYPDLNRKDARKRLPIIVGR